MTLTIVLGMHRSGTSVLTAGLRQLGLDPGSFADTPDPHNPRGYAEHPEVTAFNERLLAHLGVAWDNWGFHAATAGLEGPDLAPWRAEAAALLRRLFDGRSRAVLKDPRITTLLPFWRAVVAGLERPVRWLMILRHPDEVAQSQIQRQIRIADPATPAANGVAMQALWAVTMHSALLALPGPGVLLLRHDRLLADPEATLTGVARALDLPLAPGAAATASGVVEPGLYRARPSGDAAGGAWGAAARELWTALTAGLAGPQPLTPAQGRMIATAQARIVAALPGLPAVQLSLAALQARLASHSAVMAGRARQFDGARRAVWALAAVAQRHAPAPVMTALLEDLTRITAETAEDLPLGITRAQLAIRLGRQAEAAAILSGLCALYPGNPLPERLLAGLSPAAAGAGPGPGSGPAPDQGAGPPPPEPGRS